MDKMKHVEKSREGVPIWDGDAATFQEFEESALVWEQSVAHHKRYLCAPKLMAELQGTARRFVLGKRPDWVSYNGGVERLMAHLRSSLGLPQLPELTDYLTKFFKQGRRKKGETMNDYITRKTETYVRACQSLSRVMQTYGSQPARRTSTTTSYAGPWSRYAPSAAASHASPPSVAEEPLETEDNPDPEPPDPWAAADGSESAGHQPTSWWTPSTWDDGWWSSAWSRQWEEDVTPQGSCPELLPDMIQGWYLLCDAGLDTGERNMILASLKQDFSFNRVAQELRNQWTDEDLRRRDQSGRNSGWWVDETAEDDGEVDEIFATTEDLNEEGKALMIEAQEQAEHAMAAVQQGRRTLREARDKQHQVRMSRRYFKTTFKSYKGDGKGQARTSSTTCLRCGGDHRTSNCPKTSSSASASVAEQSAPFVCFAEGNHSGQQAYQVELGHVKNEALTAMNLPTTQEVVEQGKAVLDGGATKTLGSVHALEKIMELNQKNHGDSGIASLDLADRPTFGFGNGATNQCLSTAELKIHADGKDGRLQVHALDSGEGPVLFSVASLRALGAVVDFAEDLVVFRKLNDQKVIQLERSNTGHQLLPMTQDWYESSFPTAKPVPSLRQHI